MRKFVVLGVCLCSAWARSGKVSPPLTTDDIASLLEAGFGEPLIVHVIESSGVHLDRESEAVARLRKWGAGDNIISAIHSASEKPAPRLPLLDPGVYVKRLDAYALVPPEPIEWRGSSSAVRAGESTFTRISITGRTDRRNSPLVENGEIELLIVCGAGDSASEYRLLRGEVKEESREFRAEAALRDGVLLGIGAASASAIPMRVDKRFDLGVRFLLNSLPKGEYGLIRSNVVTGGQVIPAGVIYTFSVE